MFNLFVDYTHSHAIFPCLVNLALGIFPIMSIQISLFSDDEAKLQHRSSSISDQIKKHTYSYIT